MFCECASSTKSNPSNFNTNNATNMGFMFCGCYNSKELNIPNFNTNNATNMNSMFYRCKPIKKSNISSNFNTNNVTDMKFTFSGRSDETSKKTDKNKFDLDFNIIIENQ